VVKRDEKGKKHEGNHDTLAIEDAPPQVVKVAVDAARAIGSGLYGVDLKQFGKVVKVIEVNDNPNLDVGVEDLVLKGRLYQSVMEYFVKRLDAQTRRRA
jgi:glutathione synthase/RimK-type ligase-like ATP-grasp enzyme